MRVWGPYNDIQSLISEIASAVALSAMLAARGARCQYGGFGTYGRDDFAEAWIGLEKLSNLEFKFDSMELYVKAVNDKVSNLQVKVERFEEFRKETTKSVKELEDGMSFANAETESLTHDEEIRNEFF